MTEGASGGALRELFVSIGVEGGAGEALEALDKRLTGMGGKLREFGEALLAAFAVERLHSFVEEQIHLGSQIQDTAEKLGVGVEELQKLQFAAEQSGASAEDMSTGLRFLARNMNAASEGSEEAAQTFAKQGIAIKNADGSLRSVQDVMVDVADAVAKLPPGAQRVGLAMKLLGRGGAQLIPTLSKGGDEIARLSAEAEKLGGVLGKEDLEAMHKAEDAAQAMSFAWRGMKSQLTLALLPAFQQFNAFMTDVAKKAKDLTQHTTILRVAFAALALVAATKIVPAVLELVRGLAGVESGAGLVETALAALPLLLIAGLIAGVVLVGDDLITMFEGGDSAIGGMIDTMYGLGEAQTLVDNLTGAWKDLQDALSQLGIDLPDLDNLFHDTVMVWFASVANQIRTVIKLVTVALQAFKKMIEGAQEAGSIASDALHGKFDQARASKFLSSAKSSTAEILSDVAAAFTAEPTQLSDSGARVRTDRVRAKPVLEQRNHIEIHNHGVGKDVGEETEKGVRTALDDFQNETAFEAYGLPGEFGGIE